RVVNLAFGRQNMKRSQFQIVQRIDRPAILAICLDVAPGQYFALTIARRSFSQFQPALLSLTEQSYSASQSRARSCPDCGILLEEQRLRFDGPGHQLAVQTHPIGLELFPEMRALQRLTQPLQQRTLQGKIIKEAPPGTRIADATTSAENPKTALRGRLIA